MKLKSKVSDVCVCVCVCVLGEKEKSSMNLIYTKLYGRTS